MFSKLERRRKRELYRELATGGDWSEKRAKALSHVGNVQRFVALESFKTNNVIESTATTTTTTITTTTTTTIEKECALAYGRSANLHDLENSVKSIVSFEMKQSTYERVWEEFKEYKLEEEERDPEVSAVMDDDFYKKTKRSLEGQTEQTRYLRNERRNVAKRLTKYVSKLTNGSSPSKVATKIVQENRKKRRRGQAFDAYDEEEEEYRAEGRKKRAKTKKKRFTINDVVLEKKKREEEKRTKRAERASETKKEKKKKENDKRQKFTGKESFFDFFEYARNLIDGALKESNQTEIKRVILTLKGEMVTMDLENGVIDTNKLTGDERMEAITIALDLFVWKREETQMEMHDEMLRILLPIIYGDEWDDNYERILAEQGLLKHMAELFIICARRWGKTVGCAMMVAILMIFVPSVTIAIFSTGQRAAGKFMIQVQKFMFQLPFMDSCKIVRCNDETMIISMFGNERRMDAYPCTVGVCYRF
jgi:hypothetical protein